MNKPTWQRDHEEALRGWMRTHVGEFVSHGIVNVEGEGGLVDGIIEDMGTDPDDDELATITRIAWDVGQEYDRAQHGKDKE
jgi:phage baseplate assembly protein gpV